MLHKKPSSQIKPAACIVLLSLAFYVLVTINADAIVENISVSHSIKYEVFDIHALQTDTIESSALITDSAYYTVVDEPPSFPGGRSAREQFLRENINQDLVVETGRVICSYIVQASGEITDVKVIHGVNPLIDNEIQRVMAAMPRHIPAKKNGVAVPVLMVYELSFYVAGM